MLAVVEHEQELARCQLRRNRIDEGGARERAQFERFRNRIGDACALGDRVELDEDGAVGLRVLPAARELKREARLPRAARAGEREQAGAAEQGPQLGQLVLAADERARLERQPPPPRADA